MSTAALIAATLVTACSPSADEVASSAHASFASTEHTLPLVARHDYTRVAPGGIFDIDVLANDVFDPLRPLALAIVAGPASGGFAQVLQAPSGRLFIRYSPRAALPSDSDLVRGLDVIRYQIVQGGMVAEAALFAALDPQSVDDGRCHFAITYQARTYWDGARVRCTIDVAADRTDPGWAPLRQIGHVAENDCTTFSNAAPGMTTMQTFTNVAASCNGPLLVGIPAIASWGGIRLAQDPQVPATSISRFTLGNLSFASAGSLIGGVDPMAQGQIFGALSAVF
jgi:hypothetical protein